jgi:hypothetical protein
MWKRFYSVKNDLNRLANVVEKLKSSTSRDFKIKTLQEYPDLQNIFGQIYDPHIRLNFTSASLENYSAITPLDEQFNSLSEWFDRLRIQPVNVSKNQVALLLSKYPEQSELIKSIIDKNLKCRIGPKILKRAFGIIENENGDIFDRGVALAHDWKDKLSIDFIEKHAPSEWLYSRKLDGVRCITKLSNQEPETIKMYTRNRKDIKNAEILLAGQLNSLKAQLLKEENSTYFLDGELCVMDELDREDFSKTCTFVRSQKIPGEIPDLWYFIFDCLKLSEIQNPKIAEKFSTRLARIPSGIPKVVPLAHFPIPDNEPKVIPFIDTLLQERCLKYGHEGLILRLNTGGFFSGRTRSLLKAKLWLDAEFPFVRLVHGPMRYVRDGKEIEEELVSALVIQLPNGQECSVGSGLSMEQRKTFTHALLKDKLLTIKFQERMPNGQLRFPIFKNVFEE